MSLKEKPRKMVNELIDERAASGFDIKSCGRCDGCGGAWTYRNQACLPINGKVRCIDWCIHQIVAALNAGGVGTTASCCGHEEQDGRIDLADGRVLIIKQQGDVD